MCIRDSPPSVYLSTTLHTWRVLFHNNKKFFIRNANVYLPLTFIAYTEPSSMEIMHKLLEKILKTFFSLHIANKLFTNTTRVCVCVCVCTIKYHSTGYILEFDNRILFYYCLLYTSRCV